MKFRGSEVRWHKGCCTKAESHMNAPEIALFGEWNTSNLGVRAIHAGVQGFFEDCGWHTRSYAFDSLTQVSANPSRRPLSSSRSRAARVLRAAGHQYRALRLLPSLRQADA